MRSAVYLISALLLFACKDRPQSASIDKKPIPETEISYAEGFTIERYEHYSVLHITNPWPGADKAFSYLLLNKNAPKNLHDNTLIDTSEFDAVVHVPVSTLVVTSTTHIPSLDMLDESEKLVGFPNLDYISSPKTRALIAEEKIKELGQNESINTEVLIELSPDAVVSFAVDGANKSISAIEQSGIPVLYNSDWTETHPLGKAEWIKFFGAILGKQAMADSIFGKIEKDYLQAKELAATAPRAPTVLSGAMYKDIWYMPQGNSWAARFIEDAKGNYLWSETSGTGSLSLSLESVLERAREADFWIGPGQFVTKEQFEEAHNVYGEFDALQQDRVYTFTARKGETGGVIYYELAPNRPDLVLKDIIAILHPELLPEHEFNFFSKVE